jgi:Ni/Co efflux regulator RcnB
MKKLLTLILPAAALFCAVAATPQAASARDGYSSTSTTVQVRGDRDSDNDRDSDRTWWGRGRHHCRMVTTQHWSDWRHRMVVTQERVCRR